MASYLGIDIGTSAVRAVLLRTSYRKVTLAGIGACDLAGIELAEAVKVAVGDMSKRCDGVAVAMPGDRVFTRRISLPATAMKQLAEVVPFEIEAQIPFDLSEAVFDYRTLPRDRGSDQIEIFAAIARQEEVQARIELLKAAGVPEPELVAPGAFALASLVPAIPELASANCLAVVDLGAMKTEVVIAHGGDVLFARTLSVGTSGLPASAAILARELRQTLSAWRAAGGAPIDAMYLAGGGAMASGAEVFLAGELGVTVAPMPMPKVDGIGPELAPQLPRAAKALALALSLANRAGTLNLRQGPLAFERGYAFLREKIPVLAGLGIVIVVSSLFATWAEMRSLSKEREVLENALSAVSKDVLGEETTDPARVAELIETGPGGKDEDPLPRVDAFDVMAQLAEAVPDKMKHDVEDLDVQRSGQSAPHVSIHGVVPKVSDAEDLATKLKEFPCFADLKITKTSQVIGSDGQKYAMEFDLRCPSRDEKKTAGASPAGSAKEKEKDK